MQPNLAKSSYRWSTLQLNHKIEKKYILKKRKNKKKPGSNQGTKKYIHKNNLNICLKIK